MWPTICGKPNKKCCLLVPNNNRSTAITNPVIHSAVGSHSWNNAPHLLGLQLRPLLPLNPVLHLRLQGLLAQGARCLNLIRIHPLVRYRTPPSPWSNRRYLVAKPTLQAPTHTQGWESEWGGGKKKRRKTPLCKVKMGGKKCLLRSWSLLKRHTRPMNATV